jgi:hypothetical protein
MTYTFERCLLDPQHHSCIAIGNFTQVIVRRRAQKLRKLSGSQFVILGEPLERSGDMIPIPASVIRVIRTEKR